MRSQSARRFMAAAFAFVALASSAGGQNNVPAVPQVITVGRGEVDVKPDRARLEFGVETRASTATAAASENSRRQHAVLDTLQKMGIAPEQLQTATLQVNPEMVYPGQGQPPKVSGYVARNSVRVEVLKLDQTGVIVDAALAKGANNIMGLQFYSSKAAEGRREALARAVTAARLDAEVMAKAAGYQLGSLIEISSGYQPENPIYARADFAGGMKLAAAAEQTPVNPGELKFTETVTVRWAIKQ